MPALIHLPSGRMVNLHHVARAHWSPWADEGHKRTLHVAYVSGATERLSDADGDKLYASMAAVAIAFLRTEVAAEAEVLS